jgi:hypothetical protein
MNIQSKKEEEVKEVEVEENNNNTFDFGALLINKYVKYILHNFQCSYCNEYQNISNHENKLTQHSEKQNEELEYKNWNLYLKEFDEYSALILYHSYFKKDVIELFQKYNFKKINGITLLDNQNNNRFITLEFVSKNEDENTSIWVPSEKDLQLYERIIESTKKFDTKIGAYFIGTYNIKNF